MDNYWSRMFLLFNPGSTSWRQRQSQWEDRWWTNHSIGTSSGVFQISPGCRPSVRWSTSVSSSKFSKTLWLQPSPFCRWYFLVPAFVPSCSSYWTNLTSWCRGNCLTFLACADIFILLGIWKNRTSPSRLPDAQLRYSADDRLRSSLTSEQHTRKLFWSASRRHSPPCLPVFADSSSVVTSTSFMSLPPVRCKALFTASSSPAASFFTGICVTTNKLVMLPSLLAIRPLINLWSNIWLSQLPSICTPKTALVQHLRQMHFL